MKRIAVFFDTNVIESRFRMKNMNSYFMKKLSRIVFFIK